jgi:type I restriction enzyme M protein
MQIFYSALNEKGRAGFVMANSASDARQSESDIRKQFVDNYAVDVMISIGPQFFYTVILPCTLWFFDKGKKNTGRKEKILFIDARNIYRQIDRAHRDFTPGQLQYIANIARIYRGEEIKLEKMEEFEAEWKKNFPKNKYRDIPGLCKAATLDEVREQNYSLNPGRYVGVTEKADDDFDFYEKLEELNEELDVLNSEARELEEKISENITNIFNHVH